ncbi:NTE family protein [Halospina denitrificans]|uniref:NTE family protein n=1 Tax=Halospina denitrificans TaxID=332522 RepID=A0A4R7JTA9_9GAMM|nr:patatin-like phospholipase family protein [Halospina denitrificans]TDT41551.1 NTE family protein [Halospina denitrificans]
MSSKVSRNDRTLPGEGITVALVLGSGGARGYAHIGVIEVLREQGYDIIAISGASMGALIGGMYGAGTLTDYKDWVTGLDQFQLLRLLDFSLGSPGAIRGEKVFGVVHEMLGDTRIEDLSIDFTAVATDLLAHKEIWFQEGPLYEAVRASAAIPSVLTPVMMNGRVLVDGGLLNPVPIIPTVASHADMIVAVNLSGLDRKYRDLPPLDQWSNYEKVEGSDWPDPSNPKSDSQETDPDKEGAVDPSDEADASPDEWIDKLKQRAARWFDWDNQDPGGGWKRNKASSEEEALQKAQARFALRSRNREPTDDGGDEGAEPVSLQELGLGKFDVMNLSLETMQHSLTRYKLAGYPPDLLINFPKHVCRSFDYHKAPELIQLGRMLAEDALAEYRQTGNPMRPVPGPGSQ